MDQTQNTVPACCSTASVTRQQWGCRGGLQAASISSKLVSGHRNTEMGCHAVCSSNEVPRGQMLSACQSSVFLLGAFTCATFTGEQVSPRRLQTGPDLPSNSRGRPVLPSTYWVRPYTHRQFVLDFFFPLICLNF